MKTTIAVMALVGAMGVTAMEVVAQDGRAVLLFRACEIEPGQNVAAQAIAEEFIDLYRTKYEAGGNAWTHVLAPFDHMHFTAIFPDFGTFQSRTDGLLADPDYQALVRKAQDGILGECTDELLRAVIPAPGQ